jgi:hypothetical protein
MMRAGDLRRLIELAFDYVSAETEQQVKQAYDQAAMLTTETMTFEVWLNLTDYIREWSSNPAHKDPMSRAVALQFFLARQIELRAAQT